MHIYPDYYENFKCIAQRCRHNCCIGWEIDIDNNSLGFYNSVDGKLGEKLNASIELDPTPHFKLTKDERCPFLNEHNLCDIIIELGENHICNICREHPRFHNELPGRTESGIGLCCEEAARIILAKKEKVTLKNSFNCDDEIIALRDRLMCVLQDRDKSISERLECMLTLCGTKKQEINISKWCDILHNLEQLDKSWGELLSLVKKHFNTSDTLAFDSHMKDRVTEYEQFAVYILYRHFANAPDMSEAQKRAKFVDFAYRMLYTFGAVIYSVTGSFNEESQIELARLFSSEIEYSDENLYTLFELL